MRAAIQAWRIVAKLRLERNVYLTEYGFGSYFCRRAMLEMHLTAI
jgi:hypothetical protein